MSSLAGVLPVFVVLPADAGQGALSLACKIIEMLMVWHKKAAMSLGKHGLANAPREACRVTSFSG